MDSVDEAEEYLTQRVEHSMEAWWKLYGYKMADYAPSVLVLDVNDPTTAPVHFLEDQ